MALMVGGSEPPTPWRRCLSKPTRGLADREEAGGWRRLELQTDGTCGRGEEENGVADGVLPPDGVKEERGGCDN